MTAFAIQLGQTLDALVQVGARLRSSLEEDAALFPMSEGSLAGAGSADLKALDAFLQRFQQTADQILRKLLPRLVAAADETSVAFVFRELLERLDRLGAIDGTDTWTALQQLRNRLTHEYVMGLAERAQDLNTAWAMAPLLLDQIERAAAFADKHNLRTREKP
ncbi:hypothetical protein [Sphingomonas sp. ID0503]|uniref:hypothetical protein n=1 Tax=Sphingomonas sp. ID0503 TaxID=3399691 RepID=UPI003AFADBEC